MSTDRVCIVSLVGALAALGVGCSNSAPRQPTSVVPAVSTVTKLPACTAANKGQVVFLASIGSGTLETCNGTAFVATVCNSSNIDQVLYIVSQATFEACTGSSWTAIPFAPNGVNVGTGPDSIIGTVAGPNGPLSGATVALSGNAASTATTDANGHYAFTGLANGSYGVSVSAGAGCSTASTTLNNISGLREADFTLTSTGKSGVCAAVTGPQGPAGPTGPAGSAGAESLVSVTTEPAGANCAAGGQRIAVGIDTNSNGVLEMSEIQHTSYVCNGTSATGACAGLPDNTSCAGDLYGSCQSGACACYQGAAPVTCTSGPSCMNWGFESGTTEGWAADPASLGVTNLSISTSHFHSGTRSLAVSMSIAAYSANDARAASVAVPLCASSGTANLAGSTFSAWVLFTTTNGSLPMNAANLLTDSLSSGAVAVQPANLNTWIQLHGTIIGTSATTASLNVEFPIANPTSEGFTGVMYVDDVQISPPTVLYSSCQSGACTCYQGAPPVTCTSGPSCMNWGFESGTTEGWAGDPASLGVTNVSISTSHFHSGTRSLAVSMSIAAFSTNDARGASVAVPLCASTGTTNLAGYTFSAWAFFTTTNGSLPMNAANLLTDSLVSSAVAVQPTNLNTWIQLHGSISATSATSASLNVEFPIANPSSEGFTGVMYIDDVQISPP